MNEIALTLSELSEEDPREYLFAFYHDQEESEITVILSDTSTTPDRYNLFIFTEGVDITLEPEGDYTYIVYEQPDGSGNLDPTLATREVERGKMLVTEIESTEIGYSYTDEDNISYELD